MQDNKTAARYLREIDVSNVRLSFYSLEWGNEKEETENSATVFHGHTIMGQTEVLDQNDKKALLRTLAAGIEKSDGTQALCFLPRHGLRVTTASAQFDLSICFTCLQVYSYNFVGPKMVTTTREPQKLYDSLVRKYKLPHAKDPPQE